MSSIRIMSAIYDAPVLSSREREVLLVLANHAGSKGERLGRAYPSQRLLAAELCIGLATVERAMRQLYAMRVIMKYPRGRGDKEGRRERDRQTNEYEINIKWLTATQRRFEDLRERLRGEDPDGWLDAYQAECKREHAVLYRDGVAVEHIPSPWLDMGGLPNREELAKLSPAPQKRDKKTTLKMRGSENGDNDGSNPSPVRGEEGDPNPSISDSDPSNPDSNPSPVRAKPLEPLEPLDAREERPRREVTGDGALDGEDKLWTAQAIALVEWCRSGRWPDGDGDPLLPTGRTLGIGPPPDHDDFEVKHFMLERLVNDEILPALHGSSSVSAIQQIRHGVGPKLRARLKLSDGDVQSVDARTAKAEAVARCKSLEAVSARLYQKFMGRLTGERGAA
jgi:hypothetical protein